MHGRLKVKSTAEQEEAKRKEREKKLKLYQNGTSAIFAKRAAKQYDSELLNVSGELLSANSDFSTLWNIRRETFTHLKENESEDDMQSSFQSELGFLEQCLRLNPKSYGSWHHRSWVLDNMPQPDWARELQLCNKFLEYDERNFHCWDYRRFVVSRSGVSPEDELAFTTSKIESNFSNYSSWHYRSKLLPIVSKHQDLPGGISAEERVNECMLAQNAFFTDPNDQSAWFYHRWLLGRVTNPLRFECVHICRKQWRMVVGLSQSIKLGEDTRLEVYCEGKCLNVTWHCPAGEPYSKVWVTNDLCDIPTSAATVSIVLSESDREIGRQEVELQQEGDSAVWRYSYKPGARFRQELSAVTSDVLTQELDSLEQLHDMEPDNKWVLLTIVSVMRALDPLKYENETNMYISKLIEVDPMRTNYFKDLQSKYSIENAIEKAPSDTRDLDLTEKNLTTLSHVDYMITMETIDLSENRLTSIQDGRLLQCVKSLKLDKNCFSSCESFKNLGALEELSLCDNNISTFGDLQPLMTCPQLKKLYLTGNPICSSEMSLKTITNLEVIC